MDSEEFEGADFIVTSGDYDKLLEKVKHKTSYKKKEAIESEQKTYYADT